MRKAWWPLLELVAVDRAELVLQRGGGGEAVGDRVGVGQRVDVDLLRPT